VRLEIVIDKSQVDTGLKEVQRAIQRGLWRGVDAALGALRDHVVTDKLQGQVLQNVTGRLSESIQVETPTESDNRVTGSVFSDSPYAAVQELGGRGYYPIDPVRASILHFFVDGDEVFTRHVNHPPLIARSFMHSTLVEHFDNGDIKEWVSAPIMEALGLD
jgi:phage gpG-like protein